MNSAIILVIGSNAKTGAQSAVSIPNIILG